MVDNKQDDRIHFNSFLLLIYVFVLKYIMRSNKATTNDTTHSYQHIRQVVHCLCFKFASVNSHLKQM